ncbi:MAG: RidA family protein [Patescibacteria group bacterium]|jgi:enamine deaminase RidA (YjgF/YER057c/UK114 family)
MSLSISGPLSTSEVAQPVGSYSQAWVVPSNCTLVFLAGQLAMNQDGSMIDPACAIEEEVELAVINVIRLAEASGGSKEDICRIELIVACDFGLMPRIDAAYAKVFGKRFPPRVAYQVAGLARKARVEVVGIVAIPDKK